MPDLATHPIRTYEAFDWPRQPQSWIEDGQIAAGHEINGLALPYRVIETLGRTPDQYLVIGETRYSDGRWYLDFAVNARWVEATKPVKAPCPDCGGVGTHDRVSFVDAVTGRTRMVRCPNDTAGGKR